MGSVISGAVSGVSDILSDPLGHKAIRSGMADQAAAAEQANQTLKDIYDQQRSDAQPWTQAGQSALTQMQNPYFQQNFSMSDFQADPSYQFRMQQGMDALQGSAAARGGLLSGNTLKGIQDYSQGLASQEYQNAYDRFNQNQQNRFGRLSSIAGLGENALGQTMGAGTQYANAVGNNQTGLGNAYAAGNMAIANSNQQMLGAAATAYGAKK